VSAARDPRLVVRFAVFSGLALLVALAVGLAITRATAGSRARGDVRDDARFLAARLGHDDLARTAFLSARLTGAADPALLDEFLEPASLGRGVLRVTLFSPEGWVTYSTDHTRIGTRPEPARVARALRGDTVSRRHRVSGKEVIDSFVPVTWSMDPGRPRGVLGVESDYSPVAAQVRQEIVVQAGAMALALLVLYVALLPIMHRITVTLRERAERLRTSLAERQRLAAIVEGSNDAIVGRDRDGAIETWNLGAERIYGWTEAEVLGKSIEFLLPGADRDEPELGETLDPTRTVHVRKDGTSVQVSVAVSPIRDEEGELVGSSLIVRDVTAVVELEHELREAQRQEAVARIAAAMAHDLEELVQGIVPNDAGARGLRLLRQLKELGSEEPARPERIDLNRLLSDLRLRLALQVGDRIELSVEPDAGRADVHADPRLLERLLLDLALSAHEAMPDGGKLSVTTADVDFARRSSKRRGTAARLEAGRYVMLSVTDTGVAHHSARMGLGIATVFTLVEQSGGTIGIETAPGIGTTVRVYLPRAEEASPALALAAGQTSWRPDVKSGRAG
jgi:PAS domain S-box-containing protein